MRLFHLNKYFSIRFLYLSTAFFVLLYFVVSLFIYPSVVSDSAWGFLIWKFFLNGAPFHNWVVPTGLNLAESVNYFEATWTPGQYLVPGFIQLVTGMKLGYAISITTFISSISLLCGIYKIFTHLKINPYVIAVSIFIISLQRYISYPFAYFTGGEVLVVAAAPWLVLYVLKFSLIKPINLLIFTVLSLIAFVLKSTLAVLYLTLMFYSFVSSIISVYKQKQSLLKSLFNWPIIKFGLLILVSIAVYAYLVHHFYTSKGHIAALALDGFSLELNDLTFSLNALLFGIFSYSEINIPFLQSNPNVNMLYFLLLSIISVSIFYSFCKSSKIQYAYKLLLLTIAIPNFIFMFYNLMYNNLHMQSRHIIIVSLLGVPALIQVIIENKYKILKFLGILFFCLSSLYGLIFFANKKHYTLNNLSITREKTSTIAPADGLKYIYHLDDSLKTGNNLFYLPLPDIGYSFKNRTFDDFYDFHNTNQIAAMRIRGTVDNLFIFIPVLPSGQVKVNTMLSTYLDYDFKLIYKTDKSLIYKGIVRKKKEN